MSRDRIKHGEYIVVEANTHSDLEKIQKDFLLRGVLTTQASPIVDGKVVITRPFPRNSGVSFAESVLSDRI